MVAYAHMTTPRERTDLLLRVDQLVVLVVGELVGQRGRVAQRLHAEIEEERRREVVVERDPVRDRARNRVEDLPTRRNTHPDTATAAATARSKAGERARRRGGGRGALWAAFSGRARRNGDDMPTRPPARRRLIGGPKRGSWRQTRRAGPPSRSPHPVPGQ